MRLKAPVGHLMKSSTGGLWELERIAIPGQEQTFTYSG